jgi:transposase
LIWDNLNTHISAAMRAFIEAHPGWLTEARLPAYAPDLNAVEGTRVDLIPAADLKPGVRERVESDLIRL